MTIADLFINLGIKGTNQTKDALKGVRDGLGEAKSMSLEAKAALAAVAYGMERLMSGAAERGQGLANFNALTGESAVELQKWQYAAQQAGVSGAEMQSSFMGVQNAMTELITTGKAPTGWNQLAEKVHIDPSRVRDTFYMLNKLDEYSRKVGADVGNKDIRSFGVTDNTISAMRRSAFRPEMLAKAPVLGNNEINQLAKVDAAFANLGTKIQMAFAHFTASHGGQMVNDLSMVTTQVIKMTEAFVKLADSVKLMKGLTAVFEGWGLIFEGISKTVDNIGATLGDDKKKKEKAEGDRASLFQNLGTMFATMAGITDQSELQKVYAKIRENQANEKNGITGAPKAGEAIDNALVPASRQPNSSPAGNTTNFQQTLEFNGNDGKNASEVGNSTRKAVQEFFRSNPRVFQGS